MSRPTIATPNQLVENLMIAAKIALGAEGLTTTPPDRKRLYDAVVALEHGVIVEGNWRLECVLDGDLQAIARLVKRAAKSRGKNHAR